MVVPLIQYLHGKGNKGPLLYFQLPQKKFKFFYAISWIAKVHGLYLIQTISDGRL